MTPQYCVIPGCKNRNDDIFHQIDNRHGNLCTHCKQDAISAITELQAMFDRATRVICSGSDFTNIQKNFERVFERRSWSKKDPLFILDHISATEIYWLLYDHAQRHIDDHFRIEQPMKLKFLVCNNCNGVLRGRDKRKHLARCLFTDEGETLMPFKVI